MCGIIGYNGNKKMKQEELKILLYFAEERGDDSCGVGVPNKVFKKEGDPHDFIMENLPVDKSVIGHTRGATTGDVNDENAHPFQFGNFIGIHNGMINNFEELQAREGTDFEVDSEIIWYLFEEYGLREALPKLRGWLALAWLDEDGKLHLYRHRAPTYIGRKEGSIYFASDKTYLEAIDCKDVEKTDPWYHYIISDGEIEKKVNMNDCKPRTVSKSNFVREKSKGKEEEGSKTNVRFPEDESVPDHADFTYSDHSDDIAYYYWRGVNQRNLLYVQPVIANLEHLPDLYQYDLWDDDSVARLKKNATTVYDKEEIQNTIKK